MKVRLNNKIILILIAIMLFSFGLVFFVSGNLPQKKPTITERDQIIENLQKNLGPGPFIF